MCIAIYKPAKLVIPEEHLTASWRINSDGAGFAYVNKKRVIISKGHMKYKEFLESYQEAFKENRNSPFLIHFRIRTMGEKIPQNTHPFAFKGGALIHNGTITGTGASPTSKDSDTKLFRDLFEDDLAYDFVAANKKEWEEVLDYNKVVLLYDDGRFHILNEKKGMWRNDIWYSNGTFNGGGVAQNDSRILTQRADDYYGEGWDRE